MFKFLIILTIVTNLYAVDKGSFLGGKRLENMPSWFKSSFLDFAEDAQEAKDESKHLILYFHQDGCPYCAKLVEDNFTNPILVKKLRKNFDVVEVNMWGDRELTDLNGNEFTEKQYAEFLKVQFTPTLFFIDNNGDIALRMNGYQSTDKMQKILNFIKDKHYKNTSFADFIKVKNNNHKLNSQSFFSKAPHILTRNNKYPASKLLAVFFEEGNCSDCDNFHTNILSKSGINKMLQTMEVVQLGSKMNERIINTNGKRITASNWYKKLNLTYKPAVVIFDENGGEIIRKDGMLKEFHFESVLDYALSGAYKTQKNFQRFIEHRADKIIETGKNVDIWK